MTCLFVIFRAQLSFGAALSHSFSPIFEKPGSIFPLGEKIVLKLKFSGLGENDDEKHYFSYNIEDFSGKQVDSGDGIVNYDKMQAEIFPQINEGGWFLARIALFINNQKIEIFNQGLPNNADYVTFAVTPKNNNTYKDLPFGICEHYLNEENAEIMRTAGIGNLRIDVFWDGIQKDKFSYNWDRFDNILKIAKKYDIKVLPIIDYGVPWASTAPHNITGYDRTRYMPHTIPFLRFLNFLVERYQNEVDQWEVWNEPNIGFWKSAKEKYAELLKIAYEEIKSVDSKATVLMGGMSEASPEWIKMLYREGAINSFDAYNIHPYHYQVIPEKRLPYELKKFNSIVDKLSKKPIWITEIGAPTNIVSLQEQASYLVRDAVISLANGGEKFFWYELADHHVDSNDKEANFGILYHDLSPKPAYVAYAILIHQLDDAKFDEKMDMKSDSVYVYRFNKADQKIDVLWTLKDNEKIVLKDLPREVMVTNIMGVERAITTDDGILELNLTQYPIYLYL